MERIELKDPCEMTQDEASNEMIRLMGLWAKGKATSHGKDIELRIEACRDRLEIISWDRQTLQKM